MSLNSIKLRMLNMIVISNKIWHKDAVSMLRLGVLFTSLRRQASQRFSRSTVISRENYHISKSTQLGGSNEGQLIPHRITPSSPQPMTYIWKGCWLAQRFCFIYAKLHSTKNIHNSPAILSTTRHCYQSVLSFRGSLLCYRREKKSLVKKLTLARRTCAQ